MNSIRLQAGKELAKLRDFFELNPERQERRSLGVLSPELDRAADLVRLPRSWNVFEIEIFSDCFEKLDKLRLIRGRLAGSCQDQRSRL